MLWLVLAWPALAQVVNYPGSASSGGGGATNGIQMLNGSGTNTVLHNLNVISAAGAYPGDITGTAPYAGTANTYTGVVYTAGVGGPNQVNIGNLKKLKSDMASQVVNIWLFGDDALNPHTSLINSLDRYLYRGGSMLGWDVGPYMGSWYAGTITHPTWAGTVEPFNSYVGMATGSSITNQYNSYGGQINGITTTHVTPLFWKSNSFGTLTVITQSLVNGVLGTPSVLRVIDCNNSSTLTAATTNIYLGGAVPNLTASVYSTGTNMIYGIGQINTNAGSGYNFSQFHGGSFDINNLMTNSFKSNTLRQFMAPFPPSLALFHDGNTSNSLYNGLTLFHDMVANAGYATDIASVTGIPRTNDLATGDGERLSVINWARATGRTAIDTYGLFLPFDVTTFIPYYTSDAVHLTTLGNAVVGGEVVKWLGLDYPGVSAQQQLPKLTVSNLVTATLSHPAGSSGGIRTSNNFYLGWPNNAVRIIDNSTLVPTITAATPTHTLQLYSENNNHGIGLGTASGVTGGYWMSDGSILFVYGNGGAGALRARFDVANSVYSFVGNVVATSGTFIGDGSGLTNLPSGGSTTITNTTSAAGVVTGGSGSFGIGTNLTSVAGGTNSFFVAAAAANSWTNRIGDSWLLSGANSVLTVGTNTGNNTVITDGYGSFANGFWVDAGAQEYFVGKVNVGVNRGDFSLNSGTVSNITSTATLTASNVTALGTATANSVVANAILKEPKGTWGGPTNTLAANGGYYEYSSATDCAVTNISDGGGWWGTLAVSNSSAANITLRLTDARIRVTGTASTNALVIPSAKVGFLSGLRLGSTNGMTTVGQ